MSQPAPAIPEKSPFHEIAVKYGLNIEYYPFIKLEGVAIKEFRSQRVEILEHTAVVFTSRVTVDNYFRICEEARINVPEDMKYFCSTEAIALYLQKYIVYRKRKIFFADGSFANLMELLGKHKDEKFLLTLSEPHKPEMPLAMEKMKLKFDKVILAHTVSNDLTGITVDDYDMLVFYSPSEITALTGAFPGIDGRPRIAAFGHGTTKTAIRDGLTVSVMAPTPEIPSMAKAIDIYIGKVNSGVEVEEVRLEGVSPDQAFIHEQEKKAAKRRPCRKPAPAAGKGATGAKTAAPVVGAAGAKTAATAANGRSAAAGTPVKTATAGNKAAAGTGSSAKNKPANGSAKSASAAGKFAPGSKAAKPAAGKAAAPAKRSADTGNEKTARS